MFNVAGQTRLNVLNVVVEHVRRNVVVQIALLAGELVSIHGVGSKGRDSVRSAVGVHFVCVFELSVKEKKYMTWINCFATTR